MTDTPDYTPPQVWTWNKPSGGRFENINRPIAGATHEKELPVGRHPLQLYSLGTPNGVKVTIMLEELLAKGHKGAEYDAWLIKIEYAIDRFAMETKRLLDVLDKRLGESEYVAGPDYTIADMACFPWYGGLVKFNSYGGAEFLAVHEYKNVQRWADQLYARPTVKRGRMVNRLQGDPKEQLHERHAASDFDTKTADKLAAN